MVNESRVVRFEERFQASGGEVLHATAETLSQSIIGLIGQRGWHRLVSVRRNRVGHPSVLGDDPPVPDDEMAALDAVISESAGAVAEFGTVVLDHGPGQGRPSFTTIPGTFVCVVEASMVADTLDEVLNRANGSGPVTLLTGPSGPADDSTRRRPLIVVIVDDL